MAVMKGCAFITEPFGSVSIFTPEDFTAEDRALVQAARDFMLQEVLPRKEELDQKQEGLIVQLLKKAGQNGFLAVELPEAYGGLALSKSMAMRLSEEFAKDASFAVTLGAQTGIGTLPIVYYGNAEQRKKYLSKLGTGEILAAYALTEPQAGSDALAAKTTAVLQPDGKHYVLNGVKQFITNAGFADLFTVFAKIDGREFTAFLVEKTDPGVSVGAEEHKLGLHGSSTRPLILEDARIPADRLLGERGRGHKIAFNILNVGRLKLGGGSVGTAKECLETAVKYASERKQFNRPIAEFGAIQQKLADMATRIFVADSINYRSAGFVDAALKDLDKNSPTYYKEAAAAIEEYTVECSISKVFGTETLDYVADEALQVLGGYGFLKDYPIERHYRDARINRIFEGTNEINRLIIPSTVLKRAMEGKIPLMPFVQQVQDELDGSKIPAMTNGPLARERHAVEMAKRLIVYVGNVLVQKNLADLKDKQQQLMVWSNMIMDLFAMDCAATRTSRVLQEKGPEKARLHSQMCYSFVASANERINGSAKRLMANECDDDEYQKHLAVIRRLVPIVPIRTINLKTQISQLLVETQGRIFE
ncbi:MAG: acyl-CoA dehydrogenase family protein [Nitrospirae bacterium]|nr:acyl-CoA dehydrogenase family protein [Nitrospirota bacterium]